MHLILISCQRNVPFVILLFLPKKEEAKGEKAGVGSEKRKQSAKTQVKIDWWHTCRTSRVIRRWPSQPLPLLEKKRTKRKRDRFKYDIAGRPNQGPVMINKTYISPLNQLTMIKVGSHWKYFSHLLLVIVCICLVTFFKTFSCSKIQREPKDMEMSGQIEMQ